MHNISNFDICNTFLQCTNYSIPSIENPGKNRHTHTYQMSQKMTWNAHMRVHHSCPGDHRYDMRTLEADKPTVASSAPLIWMFLKLCHAANVNSRLWDYHWTRPAVFMFILYINATLSNSPTLITVVHVARTLCFGILSIANF